MTVAILHYRTGRMTISQAGTAKLPPSLQRHGYVLDESAVWKR